LWQCSRSVSNAVPKKPPPAPKTTTLHSLPLFVRLTGRPVILIGNGDAAEAKRRLLDRAGAIIVSEDAQAALAIVAVDDEDEAEAAVARLKARHILVNAVDRVALCDFTLPAIVDRDPVLIAIGTGGASAGLAKALRQRLEALLPQSLGALATALRDARPALRKKFPDGGDRRRAIDAALSEGGLFDPFGASLTTVRAELVEAPSFSLNSLPNKDSPSTGSGQTVAFTLSSTDPDDLTLKQARLLGAADRIYHTPEVPAAILDRARADAVRIRGPAPDQPGSGLTLIVSI
jgi:uroporphyrin-III C-methyltransferase / precorrin-2 dehydrogenase / sirohydrochlorin ferrochelatase